MKRISTILLAAAVALSMSGCTAAQTAGGIASAGATVADAVGAPPPATIANRTTGDEQALQATEVAYKLARIAVEIGVDANLITGERAASFQRLNRQAYDAVLFMRSVYATGNADSYKAAVTRALAAVDQLRALTGKGT